MIGKAGERFAFEYLWGELTSEGYSLLSETDREAIFTLTDGETQTRAVLSLGDREGYLQSGWDIVLRTQTCGTETAVYYEVKTHTKGSAVRSIIRLSNEQMKTALRHSDNYIVLAVVCDRSAENCLEVKQYRNIGSLIAGGTFTSCEGYSFITGGV